MVKHTIRMMGAILSLFAIFLAALVITFLSGCGKRITAPEPPPKSETYWRINGGRSLNGEVERADGPCVGCYITTTPGQIPTTGERIDLQGRRYPGKTAEEQRAHDLAHLKEYNQ